MLIRKHSFLTIALLLIAGLWLIPFSSDSCLAAQLTVSESGNGTGNVTSTPSGIDCGTECSYSFDDTSPVTLDAVAGGLSQFVGWDGCDQVAGSQCTVVVAADRTVVALFDVTTTADYYVALTGDDSNSGRGWSRPFKTINKALAVAASGEEIWVEAGTYQPPIVSETYQTSYFALYKKVNLYGGFDGSEVDRSTRDPILNQTIVDAQRSGYFGQGFYVDTEDDPAPGRARIDGFVIRGGWALGSQYPLNAGGGILVYNGAPLVANCDIKFNYAVNGGGDCCRGWYHYCQLQDPPQ